MLRPAGCEQCFSQHVGLLESRPEQHLERALTAVNCAADRAESELPDVNVRVVVVLDGCTDRSPSIAAQLAACDPRYVLLPVDFGSVGKSRQAGVSAALGNANRPLHM